MSNLYRRYIVLVSVLFVVIVGGTLGYANVEGLPHFDALYLTIVTLATVGYGDITPVSVVGKIMTLTLITGGVVIFTGVILTTIELIFERSHVRLLNDRVDAIIGIFFSEIGNRLLRSFCSLDANCSYYTKYIPAEQKWSSSDLADLLKRLSGHGHTIDLKHTDIDALKALLNDKFDILLKLLENPNVLEHEEFMNLLHATIHLREEFLLRDNSGDLSAADLAHIIEDSRKVYLLLTKQWVSYMYRLKDRYPYLFSMAIKNHPFGAITNGPS